MQAQIAIEAKTCKERRVRVDVERVLRVDVERVLRVDVESTENRC